MMNITTQLDYFQVEMFVRFYNIAWLALPIRVAAGLEPDLGQPGGRGRRADCCTTFLELAGLSSSCSAGRARRTPGQPIRAAITLATFAWTGAVKTWSATIATPSVSCVSLTPLPCRAGGPASPSARHGAGGPERVLDRVAHWQGRFCSRSAQSELTRLGACLRPGELGTGWGCAGTRAGDSAGLVRLGSDGSRRHGWLPALEQC
jgi:hypothetical protein